MEMLNQFSPLFWLLLAIVLGVIEAVTIQLVAIWPAIGALAAIIPASLKASFIVQLTVFLVVTIILLAVTRPLLKKYIKPSRQATNADRVIGEVGLVTTTIDNITGEGRVTVLGLDWSAKSQNGEKIRENTYVKVLQIQGVKLIVTPVKEERG